VFFQIDLETFQVAQQGLSERRVGETVLYASKGLTHLERIEQLADSEYGQAVFVNRGRATVSFGRDFLGHYPLSYVCAKGRLYISDDLNRLYAALRGAGVALTLSEEALALYFTMGFIPHGFSAFREIVNCEASGFYTWSKGSVRRTRQFVPIEIDENAPLEPVREAIEREIARCAAQAAGECDVSCSGGLDSSIMSVRFNSDGRRARVLTLAYGQDIHENLGQGERPFAAEVAAFCRAELHDVELSAAKFEQVHATCQRYHNTPVIDAPVPPKYALAEASRSLVITGEGADNFFGGVKNARMTYSHHRSPTTSLGWLYAVAHDRFVTRLDKIFRRGAELTQYVRGYCENLVASYPGPLLRKLLYLNSLEKPAALIFAQSYFPSRLHGLTIRHPFGSLGVYREAFRLPDHRKFVYPANKIALIALYRGQLPPAIVNRRKSGTQLPRAHYLESFSDAKFRFEALRETGFFREKLLDLFADRSMRSRVDMLAYALVTLDIWLKAKADASSWDESQAREPARAAEQRTGVVA
jgi:asparagine synthetase B (glutamine-hydrolysing)